jgi:hypothetical protein
MPFIQKEAAIQWLIDKHADVGDGNSFEDHRECERLARRFVAVNLVSNLAEFASRIVLKTSTILSGDGSPPLDYATLRDWLEDGLSHPEAVRLVNEDAKAFVRGELATSPTPDPWCVINEWLFRAAFVDAVVADPHGAQEFARTLFKDLLVERHRPPSVRQAPTPPPWRPRTDRELAKFETAWRDLAGRLRSFIDGPLRQRLQHLTASGATPPPGNELRRQLALEIRQAIDPDPPATAETPPAWLKEIAGLVGDKNNELTLYVARINGAVPPFERRTELSQLLSVLLDLSGDDPDSWPVLHHEDFSLLRSLVAWAIGCGLAETPEALADQWQLRVLGGLVRSADPARMTVPSYRVADLLADLQRCYRNAKRRRLPERWKAHRPVEDLFSYSMAMGAGPNRFRFWHQHVHLP